jgi:hypothetical protein
MLMYTYAAVGRCAVGSPRDAKVFNRVAPLALVHPKWVSGEGCGVNPRDFLMGAALFLTGSGFLVVPLSTSLAPAKHDLCPTKERCRVCRGYQ